MRIKRCLLLAASIAAAGGGGDGGDGRVAVVGAALASAQLLPSFLPFLICHRRPTRLKEINVSFLFEEDMSVVAIDEDFAGLEEGTAAAAAAAAAEDLAAPAFIAFEE